MGVYHGAELFGFAFEEEFEGGNVVEYYTAEENPFESILREVFEEKCHVVAEVKVGFAGIGFGKSAAADMVDDRLGAVGYVIAGIAGAPAEVDFFHVGEEIAVKATQFLPYIGANKHGSTGSPENRAWVIVLAMVLFEGGEHASTAEGVAVFVDETASAASILKGVALVVHQQFGLADGHFGVLLHLLYDGFDPSGSDLHIVVEQHEVVCFHLFQGTVVSTGKAVVFV